MCDKCRLCGILADINARPFGRPRLADKRRQSQRVANAKAMRYLRCSIRGHSLYIIVINALAVFVVTCGRHACPAISVFGNDLAYIHHGAW